MRLSGIFFGLLMAVSAITAAQDVPAKRCSHSIFVIVETEPSVRVEELRAKSTRL